MNPPDPKQSQQRQIRKRAALSTNLARERQVLAATQRERQEWLRDARTNLEKSRQRLARARGFSFVGQAPAFVADEIKTAEREVSTHHETVTELENEIQLMTDQLDVLTKDFGQASRLVERLLKFAGEKHPDFPGINDIRFG